MSNDNKSICNETNRNETIRQVIVVEGRDDTAAVRRAMDADTIETHGFGISEATWQLLEKAYEERGLIVFTDPDHAGENIRKRISERFPEALQAYLDRGDATRSGDIGIENASPEAITNALMAARPVIAEKEDLFTMEDLRNTGLTGTERSAALRAAVGKKLGIGGGNSKAFLRKLNSFAITKEDFYGSISEITDPKDKG